MKTIEKKIWPEYFEKILQGKKTFELRLNDFIVEDGDRLILKEFAPVKKEYTGRILEKRVGYVLKFKVEELPFYSKEEIAKMGLQIISLF